MPTQSILFGTDYLGCPDPFKHVWYLQFKIWMITTTTNNRQERHPRAADGSVDRNSPPVLAEKWKACVNHVSRQTCLTFCFCFLLTATHSHGKLLHHTCLVLFVSASPWDHVGEIMFEPSLSLQRNVTRAQRPTFSKSTELLWYHGSLFAHECINNSSIGYSGTVSANCYATWSSAADCFSNLIMCLSK